MSCLFQSISVFFSKSTDTCRQEIVSYLESNCDLIINGLDMRTWIKIGEDVDVNEYCRNMRKQNVWGSAYEVIAASLLYDVIIDVQFNNKIITFGEDIVNDKTRRIKLGYNGSHYIPIFENETE